MAIAVPSMDGVAQHPASVAIRFATLCMAHATQSPKDQQSRKMAPVPARPSEAAVPNMATAATQARSAARAARQLSVLVVQVVHRSPRTARAAQPAILLARLVLRLALAIVAPSTAIVEPQMHTAGPDVSPRLVLVHRKECDGSAKSGRLVKPM